MGLAEEPLCYNRPSGRKVGVKKESVLRRFSARDWSAAGTKTKHILKVALRSGKIRTPKEPSWEDLLLTTPEPYTRTQT